MRKTSPLRVLTKKSFVAYLAVLLLFWNEMIYPFIHSSLWDTLTEEDGLQAARILIVADPQLIGYRNEPALIGPIARIDSDRYLSRGFFYALRHGRPDVILFLGDLFDEGVEGSDEEFELTLQRFDSIFASYKSVQKVYLAGDNDIGGEGEYVIDSRRERFRKRFPNTLSMKDLGLRGVAVDEMNVFNGALRNLTAASSDDKLSIMLSHAPIIRSSVAARQAADRHSDLILSAHDHTAWSYSRERAAAAGSSSSTFERTPIDRGTVVEATVGRTQRVLELQSPTCSYRMGVPDMGYGLLTLRRIDDEADGSKLQLQARYTVLWLPGRYPQLFSYIVVAVWLLILVAHRVLYAGLRSIVLTRNKNVKQNIV
ncbi:hypothetical protein PRIPAC_80728 [Pristionchus pacificus]|uniref:Calcineurin-like phosphoesterase domain-containing protein n=1 Tax=Pristionchus pacificus TaxID=54126 RepID=A0A8R1U7V4_PRIPA|nr:hypothetical protein PRIPAC_80728 [Pristionchus pacificus]